MIDLHTHIFPPDFIKKRSELAEKDANFATIYSNPKSKMTDGNGLIDYINKNEILLTVALGYTWLDNTVNLHHNRYILEIAKSDKRIIPFSTVNVFSPDWTKVFEESVQMGTKGFGEIGYYVGSGNLKRDEWIPFMRALKEASLPLLLHVNEPVGHNYPGKANITLEEIYFFIKRFPENTIILAHLGGGIFLYSFMKEVKEALKNVYFDTAACPFLYNPEIFKVFKILDMENKILLGTDYPLLGPKRYREAIVKTMGEEFFRMISEENPRRILSF